MVNLRSNAKAASDGTTRPAPSAQPSPRESADRTVVLRCENLLTPEQAHPYLARVLNFPDYYGKNLDALFDCLTELEGCTLVLENAGLLDGGYGARLLEVLKEAASEHPGLTLVIRPDPKQLLGDGERSGR